MKHNNNTGDRERIIDYNIDMFLTPYVYSMIDMSGKPVAEATFECGAMEVNSFYNPIDWIKGLGYAL